MQETKRKTRKKSEKIKRKTGKNMVMLMMENILVI